MTDKEEATRIARDKKNILQSFLEHTNALAEIPIHKYFIVHDVAKSIVKFLRINLSTMIGQCDCAVDIIASLR